MKHDICTYYFHFHSLNYEQKNNRHIEVRFEFVFILNGIINLKN